MGRKNKLKRFADIAEFHNVIEPEQKLPLNNSHYLQGKWASNHFCNGNPIVLELGCGKGEYTVALAQKFPQKNFIGTDIKGARIWVGAKKALATKIENAAFLRTRIEFIEHYFSNSEVSEIWITFPDPQLKKGREKKRLTHPFFLEKYRNLIHPNGIIHLKTDSLPLHEFTLETIAKKNHKLLFHTQDIYKEGIELMGEEEKEIIEVKTYYEQKFLEQGLPITYLKFQLGK